MTLLIWRHPKPRVAAGICLGRLDVGVDRRKAKRLAHRIRSHARRHSVSRCVITSALKRSATVGRVLAGWGWQHRIDERLDELDFGQWDGRAWADIEVAALEAWTSDFTEHRPGGGEAVSTLLKRCAEVLGEHSATQASICAVGHAGWISAALWLRSAGAELPTASGWPAAIGHGQMRSF